MRLLIAIAAVLGLLAGPIAVSRAQAACQRAMGRSAASSGRMPAMPGAATASQVAGGAISAPCCDHAPKDRASKSCAQSCATSCAAVAALPAPLVMAAQRLAQTDLPPMHVQSLDSFTPSGLERPPRSIA